MRRPTSLLLALLAVATFGAGATWRALYLRDSLYALTTSRLDGSVAGTVAAVARWTEERRYDASTATQEADSVAPLFSDDGEAAGREGARASLGHVLHRLRTGHGYMNAWAIDSEDAVVAAAVPGEPSAAERAAARRALDGHGPQLCDPFPLPDGRLAVCYAVAGRDAGGLREAGASSAATGIPAFVIVLRSNPMGSLIPLVTASDVTGSERTVLVGRVGDSLVVIGPATNGRRDRASVARLPWSAVPALVRAALGDSTLPDSAARGRFRSLDGVEAIGAARPVDGTSWAVVRRVELAEVRAAFWRRMRTELLLAVAALSAALFAVMSATRAERSRRLREVAASEARLAETLRSSFDAVVAVDDAGRIQLFNAAAERLFRRQAPEMLGRPVTELFPERLRALHQARFVAFLDSAESSRLIGGTAEHVAVRGDGEEFAFEAIASKGVADGGRLSTIVLRDVSERRRAEEERERTLSLLRATLEATEDGILVVDREGQIAVSNRRFAEICGMADGPLSRDAMDDAIQWAALARVRDPDGFRRRIAEIYADPTGESHDVVELVDGTLIDRASKPQRVGDRVVGRVWSFRDVTSRERATAALRQAEKLAAVGQLVSGVAHELNNPLAAVLLFTEQMLEDPRTPDDVETLTLVRDQARRARAIVRDLLAFVRNTDGELSTVDARELLEHAVHALDRQIAAEGGRVELHLPNGGLEGAVRVDRAAVEQVVTNLVLNAAQAAPGHPVRIVARADAASAAEGTLTVSVEDDGPGIPPEVLPRVFEPFFTTKPVGIGTGLGLSVSLGIAQRHGGTLRAQNRAEGGARLVLTLPLTASAGVVPTAATSPVASPLAAASIDRDARRAAVTHG